MRSECGASPPRSPSFTSKPRWWTDRYVGDGYGKIDPAQPAVVEHATRLTGLLFDPTYTGKALYGLRRAIDDGRFDERSTVISLHTGGGFAALA